ncbi:MAG TPA: SMC-Scp complex subunit ScpB [Tetragenococcus sp.]|nr:SMC-Scp complex subunit ScpB [Tetragenococcus sp.]
MNELGQLEALLFAAGDEGIRLEELSFLLNQTASHCYELIQALNEQYQQKEQSALNILELGNRFLLTTKKEYAVILKKYAKSPSANHLSQAALESLSIIAYKQPITRMEIDEIRGVQSAASVQKLLIHRLIEEKGRVDGPGRAILYGTTETFMNYFGMKSLEELPDIKNVETEIDNDKILDLYTNQ